MSSDQPQSLPAHVLHSKDQDSGRSIGTHPLAQQLVQWFTAHGGYLSTQIRIAHNSSRGFHMLATGPLDSLAVVTCPLKLTLSCLNLDPDQKDVLCIDSPLRRCRGKIPDHILTYLLLIEQRNKGKDSPWNAYIACLPKSDELSTPLWYHEEDMAFLQGTSLAPATAERKKDYHEQFEHATSVMKDASITLADEINFNDLLWAATIFTSRAFISTHILPNQETIPLLFPVVDILNHSVSAKVEWDFAPHQSFSLKLLEGGTFSAGQELFNNYAPKQNDELMLGYGFCLENNPIEQFALKLAFPPALQSIAQQYGLLAPESVPFGMDASFLDKDPTTEQHFLRSKGHPFGRYENTIPCFQGIPPYIVHFFFIQAILSLEVDISTIDVRNPGAKITVHVLSLLHKAISQRSTTLPEHINLQPTTPRQTFAKTYRDGQASILHSIRLELQSALTTLLTRSPPLLLTSTSALDILSTSFPVASPLFSQGLATHSITPTTSHLFWPTYLTTSLALLLTSTSPSQTPLHTLLTPLMKTHPLPSLADGIEDAETYTFISENIDSFIALPSTDPDASAIDVLDDLGLTFVHGDGEQAQDAFVQGKTENLGVRVVMWGMGVASMGLAGMEALGEEVLFVGQETGEVEWE